MVWPFCCLNKDTNYASDPHAGHTSTLDRKLENIRSGSNVPSECFPLFTYTQLRGPSGFFLVSVHKRRRKGKVTTEKLHPVFRKSHRGVWETAKVRRAECVWRSVISAKGRCTNHYAALNLSFLS